jgi:hypothetical protein
VQVVDTSGACTFPRYLYLALPVAFSFTKITGQHENFGGKNRMDDGEVTLLWVGPS